uniref:Integrase catalytic domain-containing protein n=1 Tax=Trichuris muris TaxID=70415 RepID=A0A5S6QML0_TRIMR
MLLPAKHPLVNLLIREEHERLCHAGVLLTMNKLREKYWILGGRRTVRSVIAGCVRCKRFKAQRIEVPPVTLPLDRVREASVFEVVGVDLAGPLLMKTGRKAWVVLFTCAVYRAVHLELISSLSTEAFVQSMRRFVARRGRPSIVYSDNGTNFIGTREALRKVDWEKVKERGSSQGILWKLTPPTAAWWGGWWERLIRMLKELLRRTLGNTLLTYEELFTVLCDCEAVMNSRPLTYVSDGVADLEPLTPSMFL